MNRRDILRYAATLTGAAICAPLSTNVLAAAVVGKKEPQFFEPKTFTSITQIMDVILPRTDSPSASDVNVNFIMDNMYRNVFDAPYQVRFMKRFTKLNDYLIQKSFYHQSAEKKLTILQDVEKLRKQEGNPVFQAFLDLKQQTIAYYLSTEEVAENFLNYLPVPGGYEPCISVKEVGGKAWAI